MKVFQIGFNKCGTVSLHRMFRRNGLKSIHYDLGRIACEIRKNVESESAASLLGPYEDYDFLCDMEFICDWDHPMSGVTYGFFYFRELDAAYPGAKFILNTRDVDEWVASRKAHTGGAYLKRFINIYKATEAEVEERWRRDWARHLAGVRKHFAARPADFLELNLDDGIDACRQRIEKFFGGAIDARHFDRVNQTRKP